MKNHPNIFFFVLDAFRYDFFPMFDYHRPTTPFLSQLLETGVFFSQAYSTSTWTLPAHLSYLSGLSTFQHSVDYGLHDRTPYPNNFLFLPSLLERGAAYKSSLISEQAFLTPYLFEGEDTSKYAFDGFLPPCGCGFDFIDSVYDYPLKRVFQLHNGQVRLYDGLEGVSSRMKLQDLHTRNWENFDDLVSRVRIQEEIWPDLELLYRQSPYFDARYHFLDEVFADPVTPVAQPHFVMTNLHTIGNNFCPDLRKQWFQLYFKQNLDIDVTFEQLDFFDIIDNEWLTDDVSTATWEILHAYDLMFVDCSIRLLYEYFTERGLLTDEDYFFWVTDHGLGKGETAISPRYCHHGAMPFDWLVRVPLFVRGPAFQQAPRYIDRPVSTLDLYPTLARLADVNVPPNYQQFLHGTCLTDRLSAQHFDEEILLEATVYVDDQNQFLMPQAELRSDLREGHQKAYLLVIGSHRLVCVPSKNIMLLFDTEQDPLYQRPIQDTALVAEAANKLLARLNQTQSTAVVSPQAAQPPTDDRMVASLKALGYY